MSSFLFLLMLVPNGSGPPLWESNWSSMGGAQHLADLTLIAATGARMPRCRNTDTMYCDFLCEDLGKQLDNVSTRFCARWLIGKILGQNKRPGSQRVRNIPWWKASTPPLIWC